MHVIVVGAGIIGASCAYHLNKAGADVTVLESTAVGAGASADSFGWINANYAENDAYYQFRRSAIDHYKALQAELDLPSLRWKGALWWEEEGAAFDTDVATMRGRGYEIDVIDQAQFTALEPNFARPPQRAVLGHVEGAANGDQIARMLLAASGATSFIKCNVTAVEKGRVETSIGPMEADVILVAAGAATGSLTGLPMDNQAGILLHTQPLDRVINHIIMSPGLYLRQDADGRIIMGGSFSGAGLEGIDHDALGPMMLGRLHERLPQTKAHIDQIRFGCRPVTTDGLPAIGWINGVYVAAMHSGITLAPMVGDLVAAELTGQEVSALAPYRPDRF